MKITKEQCKAARNLLHWSQARLAKEANVSKNTVYAFEVGRRVPFGNNMDAIIDALISGGVQVVADEDGNITCISK